MLTTDVLAKFHGMEAVVAFERVRAMAVALDENPEAQVTKYSGLRKAHEMARAQALWIGCLSEACIVGLADNASGDDITDELVEALLAGMVVRVELNGDGEPVLNIAAPAQGKARAPANVARQGSYEYFLDGNPLDTNGRTLNQWLRDTFPDSKATKHLDAAKDAPGKTDFYHVTRRDPDLRQRITRV